MITLDSIFKKLIESSFKVDLNNPIIDASANTPIDTTVSYLPKDRFEVHKTNERSKPLPVFKKPKKDRVFGVFFPFIVGVAVALIPFWIFLWQTIQDIKLGI